MQCLFSLSILASKWQYTTYALTFKIIIMEILWTIIIGAIAGWLGSIVFQGSGLGLIGNIIVGILGFFVGGWLLNKIGVSLGTGTLGVILSGALGALVILVILNLLFRRRG